MMPFGICDVGVCVGKCAQKYFSQLKSMAFGRHSSASAAPRQGSLPLASRSTAQQWRAFAVRPVDSQATGPLSPDLPTRPGKSTARKPLLLKGPGRRDLERHLVVPAFPVGPTANSTPGSRSFYHSAIDDL